MKISLVVSIGPYDQGFILITVATLVKLCFKIMANNHFKPSEVEILQWPWNLFRN